MGFVSSISPKAHGAWLGAGTAAAIANVIDGLIQSYWTHAPLPAADTQLTYTLVGIALAGFGAWVMPSGKTGPVQVNLPPADTTTTSSNVVLGSGGSAGSGGSGGGSGTVRPLSPVGGGGSSSVTVSPNPTPGGPG
jgi:hypothetical protein